VGAQFFERRVRAPPHLGPQQLLVPGQEAGRVAAAVRPGREVFALAVQREHFIDEGRADAERLRDLAEGAVAAQGRGENLLPQVERIGFHGAAAYRGSLPALKRKTL
jgi:hypothetical protein